VNTVELTEQNRIWEQVDLDPWLSRQERILTKAPDGNPILRVYVDDPREVPFGRVRNIGCQIIYEPNYITNVAAERPIDTSPLTCEQRGLKER
jgi:hypothetical protein